MHALVSEASQLRRLPANLEPRQRALFDGVRFSVDMAELALDRLLSALPLTPGVDALAGHVAPFCDAWTLVDAVNRIRPLLRAIPKAEHSNDVQDFLASTEDVYRLRNCVQHLHGRLDKLAADNLPAWGVITWVTLKDPSKEILILHTLLAGSVFDGSLPVENPIGQPLRVPIDLVRLHAHGEVVTLTALPEILHKIVISLEKQLEKQFPVGPKTGEGLYVTMELHPGE